MLLNHSCQTTWVNRKITQYLDEKLTLSMWTFVNQKVVIDGTTAMVMPMRTARRSTRFIGQKSGFRRPHPTGSPDVKLTACIRPGLFEIAAYEAKLRDCDACFFCLGLSLLGANEVDYR